SARVPSATASASGVSAACDATAWETKSEIMSLALYKPGARPKPPLQRGSAGEVSVQTGNFRGTSGERSAPSGAKNCTLLARAGRRRGAPLPPRTVGRRAGPPEAENRG